MIKIIKIYNSDIVLKSDGSINMEYDKRNFVKEETIYGNVKQNYTSRGVRVETIMKKLTELEKNEFINRLFYSDESVTIVDNEDGKMLSNLLFDNSSLGVTRELALDKNKYLYTINFTLISS